MVIGVRQNAPVLQLPSDVHMRTCDTVTSRPIADFITVTFRRYIIPMVTEDDVCGLYKVEIRSPIGRTCSFDCYQK